MAFHWEEEYWFSFKDSCVSVSGGAARADSKTLGYPLFFLHGRFGHAAMWRSLMQELSPQFRSLAIDLPGFGRSSCIRDRGFSLLEHVNLVHQLIHQFTDRDEKVVLVGHDIGGGIAQLCSLQSPEKVEGLILINSACVTRRLSPVPIGYEGFLVRWKLRKLLAQAQMMNEEEKEALGAPWRSKKSRDVLIRAFRALDESWPWHYERKTRKEELHTFKSPVLLLWGNRDLVNPSEIGIEMVQRFPEAYLFVHEEAGHWPNLEQIQWVNYKMKEFMFKAGLGFQLKSVQKSLLR
jgi:pimeloyl-ACP methyl ester carboxylesterase